MGYGHRQRYQALRGAYNDVYSTAISADGKTIVSGGWDNTVRLWDRAAGNELRRFEGYTNHIESVAISARDLEFNKQGKIHSYP